MDHLPVPAAQYLRKSTDHQQYSMENQADAIAQYAVQHGFQIMKTYSDPAKSGLQLKNRTGLKQLLHDVMEGQVAFRAVLVYDVSRWGRFQDADESAHYEYLCKSSGVPIHYCAEVFSNDNSVSGLILKALKRAMAGEYSRELAVKVRIGLTRLAKLGYKLGGSAPYGLHRQLLDVEGNPKQLLAYGERKSLADEHVIFTPGTPEEIAVVRRIFREFAYEHRSPNAIASHLNGDTISYLRGAKWKAGTIRILLQDPHYIGMQVWGRTTQFLSSPVKRLPLDQWTVCSNAYEPIVSHELFLCAQQVFADFTIRLSDEQLLERLRRVYSVHGKLNGAIIETSRLCPGLSTYNTRFGGLLNVYGRLGYDTLERRAQITIRQRTLLLRSSIIKSLMETFPGQFDEVRRNKRFRPLLRYRKTGLLISIVLARCCTSKIGVSWLIEAPKSERKRTTILALLDEKNTSIKSIRVFRKLVPKELHARVREGTGWLKAGIELDGFPNFLNVIEQVRQ